MQRASVQRQRGLSLLEVVVAMAVTAGLLAWLLPASVQALQRRQQALQLQQAVELAREQVEALGVWPATLPVPSHGSQGGLQWRVDVVPRPAAQAAAVQGTVLREFRITVQAGATLPPLVDLSVQRLGVAAP